MQTIVTIEPETGFIVTPVVQATDRFTLFHEFAWATTSRSVERCDEFRMGRRIRGRNSKCVRDATSNGIWTSDHFFRIMNDLSDTC